jgi:DNA-binding PadR family transcriptional regulator
VLRRAKADGRARPADRDHPAGPDPPRTHYELTDKGREALRDWLATPARFARIQNEAIVRLASEYADRGVLLGGLESLRAEIAELRAALDAAREIEPELPHRQPALRLARRILDAHLEWLDAVEREL